MPIHTEELEYLRPAGTTPLLARHYRPEGAGPFPAVLEVHGGAWTSGDRLNNVAIGEYLAAHGIVVLSIDFRMPPAARYPETVADVNFGIRFLKANAERFSTRAELVGGLGTSSGGHLLLLNAIRAIRATPRSRWPDPTRAWPSPSSAGRSPIRSPVIARCRNAATNGSWKPTISSGPPRTRWPKAILS
jgi:acetyl esterase